MRMYCSGVERGRDFPCLHRGSEGSASERSTKWPPNPDQEPADRSRTPSSGGSLQARLLRQYLTYICSSRFESLLIRFVHCQESVSVHNCTFKHERMDGVDG